MAATTQTVVTGPQPGRWWRGVSTRAPAIDLEQFDPLIKKMGAQCLRKLPPSTIYRREDLFQEGRMQALYAARKFDPTRGAKFMTLLVIALKNRYGRILATEWRQARVAGVPGKDVNRIAEPASQGAVDAALDLVVRAAFIPDRYGKLIGRRRLCLVYRGLRGEAPLLEPLGGHRASLIHNLPALPRRSS